MGCVICSAESDPFHGRLYRLFAVIHQGILVPLITKIFNIFIKYIIEAIHSDILTRKINFFICYTNNFIIKIKLKE